MRNFSIPLKTGVTSDNQRFPKNFCNFLFTDAGFVWYDIA